jgi:hypothetical protein
MMKLVQNEENYNLFFKVMLVTWHHTGLYYGRGM